MAVAPGSTSGTYTFQPATAGLMVEAFDRIQIRPTANDRHMIDSARMSIQLLLQDWTDQGFAFWELESGTIDLAVNTATYTLPPQLAMLTELYYSAVNGGGAGVNQDRIMIPITRTQYAQLTNKLQQGIPTQYWFQMLIPPQITIWQVPNVGAPNYVLGWYGLSRIQDANLGGGEVPNIPYRATDVFCADLARRLAEKFKPEQYEVKDQIFQKAWESMTRRDQEPGAIQYLPNIALYGRMR